MALSLHHIALQVNDLEVARRFYVGVLGFLVTREQAHSLWLDAGGVIVMLELCSGVVEHGDWATLRVSLPLTSSPMPQASVGASIVQCVA